MFFANSIWCWVLIHLSKTLHRISEYKKPLHARDWWLLHHSPGKIVSMENFPSWFETLRKSHLIVTLSTFQTCRTSALKWDFHLFDGVQSVCVILSHEIDASNVEVINIRQIIDSLSMVCIASSEELSNTFRNRSVTLFKNDRDLGEKFDSVAVSESISSSMTNLSSTGLPGIAPNISPDSHTWEDQLVVNVPFWVVWWAGAQYGSPPCLFAAHLTNSDGSFRLSRFGFHRAFRCNRSKHVRIPHAVSWYQIHHRFWFCCDSFFTCIFWCYFRHRFKTVDGTENGWCWTNTKDDSIDHVWNFPLSICLRNVSWCQHIWIGSWRPSWFCQTTSQEQLCVSSYTCLIVGLLPFIIILITPSLSSNTHNKASWWEELTFEGVKSTLSKSLTTPWDCFRF